MLTKCKPYTIFVYKGMEYAVAHQLYAWWQVTMKTDAQIHVQSTIIRHCHIGTPQSHPLALSDRVSSQ